MAWHVGFHIELTCSYWNVIVNVEVNIACTLRWGVALVGDIPFWEWLTLYGTTLTSTGSISVDGTQTGPRL